MVTDFLVCLISLSAVSSRSNHIVIHSTISSFLWLYNIPLYVVSPIFLIHSSIGGYLSCFHILSTVNNVAINIPISFPISVSFSLGKYPELELVNHMVFLLLIFWGTSMPFSTVAIVVCIPTNIAWRFLFLHILANTICLFDFSHPDRWKVMYHCDTGLHFPDDQWCWAPPHVRWPSVCLPQKGCPLRSSAYFSIGLFTFWVLSRLIFFLRLYLFIDRENTSRGSSRPR